MNIRPVKMSDDLELYEEAVALAREGYERVREYGERYPALLNTDEYLRDLRVAQFILDSVEARKKMRQGH